MHAEPADTVRTWANDAIQWFAGQTAPRMHEDPAGGRVGQVAAMAVGIEAGIALALRNPGLAADAQRATRAFHAASLGHALEEWDRREEIATDCLEATLRAAQYTEGR